MKFKAKFLPILLLGAACSKSSLQRNMSSSAKLQDGNPVDSETLPDDPSSSCSPVPVTGTNLNLAGSCQETPTNAEGIDGYLVGPESISLTEVQNRSAGAAANIVKGGTASVSVADTSTGKVSELLIAAFHPTTDQLETIAKHSEAVDLTVTKLIGSAYANTDGSFSIKGDVELGSPIVVGVVKSIKDSTEITLFPYNRKLVYMPSAAVDNGFQWASEATTSRGWTASNLQFSDGVAIRNATFTPHPFVLSGRGSGLLTFVANGTLAAPQKLFVAEQKDGTWIMPRSSDGLSPGSIGSYSTDMSSNGNAIVAWVDGGLIKYRFRKSGIWSSTSNTGFESVSGVSYIGAGISDDGKAMIAYLVSSQIFLAKFNGTTWNSGSSTPLFTTLLEQPYGLSFAMFDNGDYLLLGLLYSGGVAGMHLFYQSSINGVVTMSNVGQPLGNHDRVQVYEFQANRSGQAILGIALPDVNYAMYFDGTWSTSQMVSIGAARFIATAIGSNGDAIVTWKETSMKMLKASYSHSNSSWTLPTDGFWSMPPGSPSASLPFSGLDKHGNAFVFWSAEATDSAGTSNRLFSARSQAGVWTIPGPVEYVSPNSAYARLDGAGASDEGYAAAIYNLTYSSTDTFAIREFK